MKQICNGIRIYTSDANRKRAIRKLRRSGHNYFTEFKDVQGYGLSFGKTV